MEKTKKNTLSVVNAWFLIKRAYKLNPKGVLIKIPVIVLQVLLKFIPLFLVREVLNKIQLHAEFSSILRLVFFYGFAMLICWFLNEYFSNLDNRQNEHTARIMRIDITKQIIKLPYSDVEAPQTRTFLQMIENNMSVSELLNSASNIIMQLLVLVGLIGMIGTLHPVVLILIVLVLFIRSFVKKLTRKLWNKWRTPINSKYRKVNYLLRIFQDSAYGKEIRINGLQVWLSQKMSQSEDEYIDVMSAYNKQLQKRNFFVETSLVMQELLVYLLLAYKTFFHGMMIGDFSLYISGISTFSASFSSIIDNSSQIFKAGDFFALYRELLEKNTDETDALPMEIPSHIIIKFDHVSFHYPSNDKMILKDICLELKTGKSLSIVGMNGAGKTTLVKLLCRFYKPTAGTIFLNGVDIFSIPKDVYMRLLGVVFQDFKLFAFSVAENISLSSESNTAHLSDILAKCGLEEKVKHLSSGINTSMSKILDDNGVEFSGGEGQRIELCRVLYKDPALVILDEPTASLDPVNEYELYKTMYEYTKDKCSIFISHRLASTRFTDEIVVLSDGKIVENGTFDDLIKIEHGMFKEMFNLQSNYYVR